MYLTFAPPEGTLSDIVALGPNHLRVRPMLSHSGSQWFHWCARVEDLKEGEKGVIELEWPLVARPEDLANATQETLFRFTQQGSFVEALPRITGISEDLESWQFEDYRVNGNVLIVELSGSGRPFYVATQMPYTPMHLQKLRQFVRKREPQALVEAGRSAAGLAIPAIVLESENAAAPAVYVQGYQHMTEFTGPWVADRMIRWLLDSEEGRSLRRRFTFHIVPAVDIDGLTYGLIWNQAAGKLAAHLRKKNINRDWEDAEYTEVRVIDRFLREQLKKGRRYCAGFDLHNGWISAENSGACYTIATSDIASEESRALQKQFVDHLYNSTNHEPPGRYWEHNAKGTFSGYFRKLTGALFTHTVEFSRFIWWSREKGSFEPSRPCHHERYAREVLAGLARWRAWQ